MSKIYFFRHAQASYGAVNYDQLSAKGEQQSAVLGQYLVDNDFAKQNIDSDLILNIGNTKAPVLNPVLLSPIAEVNKPCYNF